MIRSGWCSSAPGAQVPHTGCRSELCDCGCHEKAAQQSGSEHFGAVDLGANTDGPRRCANTVIQGPRRSNEEID